MFIFNNKMSLKKDTRNSTSDSQMNFEVGMKPGQENTSRPTCQTVSVSQSIHMDVPPKNPPPPPPDIYVVPQSPPLPPKPRPRLKIPALRVSSGTPDGHIPSTAGCAVPIGNMNGPFGLFQMYPSKASEYMFKRYEGFKDFTKNTAKSGLSFGEKWLFWAYGRMGGLSKRWFTHIFLFLVLLAYTVLGAVIFSTIEGRNEDQQMESFNVSEEIFIANVKMLSNNTSEDWDNDFKAYLKTYKDKLKIYYDNGVIPNHLKEWNFKNAFFYCGTIYTTIGR